MTSGEGHPALGMDTYLARCRKIIDRSGWMVQGVGAGENQPSFCYTVGLLELKQHPEIIVFGLDPRIATVLLNDLGARIADGTRYEAGQVVDDLADGYKSGFIEVEDSRAYLSVANRFYGLPSPVPALQLIFPDKAHRWPWEPGSRLAHLPLLGKPQLKRGNKRD